MIDIRHFPWGGMLRYDFTVTEAMIGDVERWRVLGKNEIGDVSKPGYSSTVLYIDSGVLAGVYGCTWRGGCGCQEGGH